MPYPEVLEGYVEKGSSWTFVSSASTNAPHRIESKPSRETPPVLLCDPSSTSDMLFNNLNTFPPHVQFFGKKWTRALDIVKNWTYICIVSNK